MAKSNFHQLWDAAIVWLDDCISYSQEARKYLEKSGHMLKKCHDEVNREAQEQRRDITARMQQGKQ